MKFLQICFLNYRRSLVYEIQSIQEQIGNWYWGRFCVYFWCNFRWFELWQNSRQARGSSFIIGLAPWWVSHCDRIYRSANVFITIYKLHTYLSHLHVSVILNLVLDQFLWAEKKTIYISLFEWYIFELKLKMGDH